ncbi:hypothetical protein MBLNU459_g2309t1 [Dothideomycetes sp. NU459]
METVIRPVLTASSLSARRTCTARALRPAYRCLHSSTSKSATPLPHPTVPGPPPQPPTAAATTPEERVARKKKQAEMLQRGKELRVNPAKPTSALRKRFWKEASVKDTADGLNVMLDSRPVRTASKQPLTLPHSKRALATGIALEWDLLVSAQQALKHHYIPLTSTTSRAIDIRQADAEGNSKIREDIVKVLMRYLSTDTLLCWAPEKNMHDPALRTDMDKLSSTPQSLRARQKQVAEPIISFLQAHIFPGVEINPILGEDTIMPIPQPKMTQEVIRGWMTGLPAFELAGLERGVLASKSLLVAARLLVEWSQEFGHVPKAKDSKDRFGIAQAAEACSVEVTWQTNMWGEVEDTHDVEKEDLARQLGSVILLVN